MNWRGWTAGLAIALGAAVAHAEPTPGEIQAARELFAQAEKDEDAGNWSQALEKLRRASSVKTTAGIRYHIALCEEKLGQIAAALNDYSGAESMAQADHNKDVLELVAAPIKALRARVPTLSIEVPSDVQGAEVTIDGNRFASGLWGIATPMEPGAHQVEARAQGKVPFSATVTLKEKDAAHLAVRMTDAPKTATNVTPPTDATKPPTDGAAKPDATAPNPATTTTSPDATAAETPPDAAEDKPRSRVPAVLATVGAVAFAGFGVGAFVAADSLATDAKAKCAALVSLPPCTQSQDSIRLWDGLALGGFIGAGLLAVTSVVLWALPSKKAHDASAELVVRPGGISIKGSF